jgi:[protein-PII] uridylyltransferase
MLAPTTLPKAPEAATAVLSDALAALACDQGKVPRDAALGEFRRHLARIQSYVQHAFEQEQISGLQAARMLGRLVDGVIGALYDHAVNDAGLFARLAEPLMEDPEQRRIAGKVACVQQSRPDGRVLAPFE